jgi:hypothetical protein
LKKILILAETIDPASSSAGKANYAIICSIVSAGFKVQVYHYSHQEILIPDVEPILIKELKTDHNYWLSRSQRLVQRLTGKNFSRKLEKKHGFSFTLKNDAKSMARALSDESPEGYDLIISLSKGASYRTHHAMLQLPEWHSKWLAYIHDPYPFHWYPAPYNWKEAGYQQKEAFFVEVATKAKWLGYPSLNLANWMGKFNSQFAEKAVVLPHQATVVDITVTDLPDYFNPRQFNVLHAGNLLDKRDPLPLIRAWKSFLESYPEAAKNASLHLVGPASHFASQVKAITLSSDTINFKVGYMDHRIVRTMESFSSVNIILEAVALESPFLPGKFPGLVMANAPILHLGPQNSETRRLLGKDYPYAVEAGDVESITAVLKLLYDQWKQNVNELALNRIDLKDHVSASFLKTQLEDLSR